MDDDGIHAVVPRPALRKIVETRVDHAHRPALPRAERESSESSLLMPAMILLVVASWRSSIWTLPSSDPAELTVARRVRTLRGTGMRKGKRRVEP